MFPNEIEEQILNQGDAMSVRAISHKNRENKEKMFLLRMEERLWQKLAVDVNDFSIDTGVKFYSHDRPNRVELIAKIEGYPGVYVFEQKTKSHKFYNGHGNVDRYEQIRGRVFWRENDEIPPNASQTNFVTSNLLFLKEYMKDLPSDFTKSTLRDVFLDMWENEGYANYFFLSVFCLALFNLKFLQLSFQYNELGEDTINDRIFYGGILDITDEVLEAINLTTDDHLYKMEQLILEWIDEL